MRYQSSFASPRCPSLFLALLSLSRVDPEAFDFLFFLFSFSPSTREASRSRSRCAPTPSPSLAFNRSICCELLRLALNSCLSWARSRNSALLACPRLIRLLLTASPSCYFYTITSRPCVHDFLEKRRCKKIEKDLYIFHRVSDCRQRLDLSDIVTKVCDMMSNCVFFCDNLSQRSITLSPRRTCPSARSVCSTIARNFRIHGCSIRLQHTGGLEGRSDHVSWKKRKSQTEVQLAKKTECPEPDADVRGCSPERSI